MSKRPTRAELEKTLAEVRESAQRQVERYYQAERENLAQSELIAKLEKEVAWLKERVPLMMFGLDEIGQVGILEKIKAAYQNNAGDFTPIEKIISTEPSPTSPQPSWRILRADLAQ